MGRLAVAAGMVGATARRWRTVVANLWTPGNVKAIAYELARQRAAAGAARAATLAGPGRSSPPLTSLVCSGKDWQSDWLPYWARRFGMQPALHRKLWEFAWIAQVLHERGLLSNGRSGLGFGCGSEPLASVFAASGCSVLATDLDAADARARSWSGGGQHADSLERVWMPELCPAEVAHERIRFRSVDMNAIPADLHGRFDFCWSSCALEHLGSIEHGLRFIRESARCLKPGGLAVHTTELNLDPGPTLDHHPTVLFQVQHFERLARELEADGTALEPVVVREEDPFLDGYVDTPPYPDPRRVGSTLSVLHLRLAVASYRTTSVGLVVRDLRAGPG